MPATIGSTGLYASFTVLTIALLAVDFFMLKQAGAQTVGTREAAAWSVVWLALGLAFGALFWGYLDGLAGRDAARARALEYFTGYLAEKSLAAGNVLAWIAVIRRFAVPAALQRRVLGYGVLGVVGMRALLVYLGAGLPARLHWLLELAGLLLLATGAAMLLSACRKAAPAGDPVPPRLRGRLRVGAGYHGRRWFVLLDGRRQATPLFAVLALLAATDLVFAVDAVPAIFALTRAPFVVFAANIFALLGLRALTVLLAGMAGRVHLLEYGLAAVLLFIGAKMLLLEVLAVPAGVALGVVGLVLAAALASLAFPQRGQGPRR